MPPLHRDLIVVGASAGGVEALRTFVAGLPADFPGTVHVAPPNHHLLVIDDQFALSHGPTENGHRPAVNALFRSAAVSRGTRVIGVQLSGVLDDGVAGLVAIKAQGGLVVVQDPADALYPGMPENAIRHLSPDHIVPAAEIGPLLAKLTTQTSRAGRAPPPAPLVDLENVIALRSPDEKASMARLMAEDAGRRGSHRLVERYNRMADESSQAADVLRERLTAMPLHAALEADA